MDNFPINRYKHCYSVGKKMYKYAKEQLGWDEKHCIEMFVLGNIHDIGYELDEGAFGHDHIIADALKGTYKYTSEIRNHSKLIDDIYKITPELELLYFADMTVDGQGKWCTLEERLKDLENRYGKGSEVYIESLKLANYLINVGYDDKI